MCMCVICPSNYRVLHVSHVLFGKQWFCQFLRSYVTAKPYRSAGSRPEATLTAALWLFRYRSELYWFKTCLVFTSFQYACTVATITVIKISTVYSEYLLCSLSSYKTFFKHPNFVIDQ